MIDMDGRTMFVSSTDAGGVVGRETLLHFSQRGDRVFARYAGGRVPRGWLVGRIAGGRLTFRYAQRETDGAVHGGRSVCEVQRTSTGALRIVEHFTWTTRTGTGVNVFDEVDDS